MIEAIRFTLTALAEPVFAITAGILLTAATYHACKGLRRLWQWGWGEPRE